MPYLIRSLNELEKLKLLLFDEEQLFLFEHIPKPLLIDPDAVLDGDDDESELEEDGFNQQAKGASDSKKKKSELLLSNDRGFWQKTKNLDQIQQNFEDALDKIQKKGKDMNMIDERLFNALNIPLPREKMEENSKDLQ